MSYGLVKFKDFLNFLIPHLPGCGDGTALLYLRSTARKFCADTESLIETLPSIDIVANQSVYAIASTLSAEIKRIKDVRLNNAEGIAAGKPGVSQRLDRFDYDPSTGNLTLTYAPDTAITDGLEVDISIVPEIGTNELPTWWMNRYNDGLIAGTLADLQGMKGMPWTNPGMAQSNKSTYLNYVGRAKNDVLSKYKALMPRVNLSDLVENSTFRPTWGH